MYVGGGALTLEVVSEMQERVVRSFLDMIILAELRERGCPLSGYDVVTCVSERFRMHMSPGTVYALLYALERDGLVSGRDGKRKRVYSLTPEGTQRISAVIDARERIQGFVEGLF